MGIRRYGRLNWLIVPATPQAHRHGGQGSQIVELVNCWRLGLKVAKWESWKVG